MIPSRKIVDYILVYLLIAFSGIPFFHRGGMMMLFPAFILSGVIFLYRRKPFHKFILYYILFALVLHFGQMIKFNYLPIDTFAGVHIKILFAYFVIISVGKNFMKYYVDVLFVSVIISFFFYFPSFIPGFETFLIAKVAPAFESPFNVSESYKIWPNLIVYTINTSGDYSVFRNSGPFWEPGAFAGFLIVALIFQLIQKKIFFERKTNILILGMITTLSSAGLVVLMLLIMFYAISQNNLVLKIMIIPLLVIGSVILVSRLDFLGEKITQKMEVNSAQYNTRFKSAVLDLKDFLENPLLGMGDDPETRFQGKSDYVTVHRNNGLTNFLASNGLIAFGLYFYFMYYSLRMMCIYYRFNIRFALMSLTLILIMGFTQVFFNKPLFFALTMIHILLVQYEGQEAKSEKYLSKNLRTSEV